MEIMIVILVILAIYVLSGIKVVNQYWVSLLVCANRA